MGRRRTRSCTSSWAMACKGTEKRDGVPGLSTDSSPSLSIAQPVDRTLFVRDYPRGAARIDLLSPFLLASISGHLLMHNPGSGSRFKRAERKVCWVWPQDCCGLDVLLFLVIKRL